MSDLKVYRQYKRNKRERYEDFIIRLARKCNEFHDKNKRFTYSFSVAIGQRLGEIYQHPKNCKCGWRHKQNY